MTVVSTVDVCWANVMLVLTLDVAPPICGEYYKMYGERGRIKSIHVQAWTSSGDSGKPLHRQ